LTLSVGLVLSADELPRASFTRQGEALDEILALHRRKKK
jgi:hypothetical protein